MMVVSTSIVLKNNDLHPAACVDTINTVMEVSSWWRNGLTQESSPTKMKKLNDCVTQCHDNWELALQLIEDKHDFNQSSLFYIKFRNQSDFVFI